jgi:hypothetical protein
VTNQAAAARREQVLELWTRGVSLSGIARALRCDRETARRDVALLAAQAVKDVDVPRELHRLLLAGRAVEADAWLRHQPLQALAAQRQQLGVLQALQGLDVERRLALLEERLDGAQVAPLAAARAGREN